MGHLPALDGLRAVSVAAVLLYHAGFAWMPGGFLGVEVFFVVSGYLITALLLDERERDGSISLGAFWARRARRLLPALLAVLLACVTWAAFAGDARWRTDLRRDLPWAVLYAANWGQITGGAPYFGNLSPLRHLWSLAVEEQWYLLWPFGFVLVSRLRRRAAAAVLGGLAACAVGATWWAAAGSPLDPDRANLLYLSTPTRASGLLLGAGAAFVWRPWRRPAYARLVTGHRLDVVGAAALSAIALLLVQAHVDDRALYRWQLPVVSVASVVAVAVAVHPASRLIRRGLGTTALVAVGRRSYGLYLWSWPISVVAGAHRGSVARFAAALAVAAVVTELSYRLLERPVRSGAFGRWIGAIPVRRAGVALAGAATVMVAAAVVTRIEPVDPAAGGEPARFERPAPTTTRAAAPVVTLEAAVPFAAAVAEPPATTTTVAATTTTAVPTTPPVLPRRVVIVGDSMAHSLAVNLPDGIGDTFVIDDGSVDGCSVYEDGAVRSARRGFSRAFTDCTGWHERWADAALDARAEVALVVLGAWDVFDVELDDRLVPFGSPEADARFLDGVTRGVDALAAAGTHVALLEVACMRPVDTDGAGVPALPERGDDARVGHLNELLRGLAAERPADVTFVEGPDEWCADETIATDLGHRWDGVHVYRPGANLIYTTIAEALVRIPVP